MTTHLPVDEEVTKLTSYFTSMSFNVTQDWLFGCVQYFRTENPRYSESEMRDCVKKQWELSDLRDSSSGCLPGNLNSHQKITLRGKYVLQIESVINIGTSAYSQIQKIRKVNIENVELTENKPEAWEPKSKRMLKMNLCDGPHTAEAIEYHPLPMVFEQITPGTKIMIIGPVDCRRGCFFLKAQNLRIIGGEVDSLLITNYMENVLARILNLPENEDPYSNETPSPVAPRRNASESAAHNTTVATRNVEIRPRRPVNQTSTNSRSRTVENNQNNNAPTNFKDETDFSDVVEEIIDLDVSGWEDDDLFVDENTLLKIEEEHSTSNKFVHTSSSSANSEYQCNGSTINKRKVPIKNPDIVVPPKVPKTIANESSARKKTNIHNSFLASDEYVDAMLELEDEEMNEVAPAIISSNSLSNRYECEFTSASVSSTSASSIGNNNFKFGSHSDKVQNSRTQQVQSASNSEKLNFQKKTQNSVCSSRGQQLIIKSDRVTEVSSKLQFSSKVFTGPPVSKKPGIISEDTPRQSNISSWCKKNKISSPPPASEISQMSSKSNVDIKESNVKSSVFGSKFSDSAKQSLPLSNGVCDEEDWGDAYLNTSAFSFLNKLGHEDEANETVSEEDKQHSFSGSSLSKSSGLQDAGKQSAALLTNVDKFKKPNNKAADKTISPFKRSQIHLPAAFCGPNDLNDNVDVALIPSDGLSMEASPFTDFPSTSKNRISFHSDSEKTSRSGVQNRVQKWTCPIKASDPFQYILHVLHSQPRKYGIYKFKATILTLLSQLSIKEEREWTLSAKIGDGSASLDVHFSSDVLEEIIGLSPREFKQMKREVSKNPLIKEKLRQVLKSSQQKLVDLNCIFSVKFEEDKMATVINLSEVTEQDVNKLKLRLPSK